VNLVLQIQCLVTRFYQKRLFNLW